MDLLSLLFRYKGHAKKYGYNGYVNNHYMCFSYAGKSVLIRYFVVGSVEVKDFIL